MKKFIFIDNMETLFDFLNKCSDNELSLHVLKGIQQNYILSYNSDLGSFYRITITDLKDRNTFEQELLTDEEVIIILTEEVDPPL